MVNKIIALILFLFLAVPVGAAVFDYYPDHDTKLDEDNPSTNYGTDASHHIYQNDAFLVSFDLSTHGTLDSADIVDAELRIYEYLRGGGHDMHIARIVRDWNESEATWNEASSGVNWGTAGALNTTSDVTTTGSLSVANVNGDWIVVDVTDMVKDMIDAGNDYGFAIRADNENGDDYLYTAEEGEAGDLRPKLSIETGTPGEAVTWYVRTDGGTCGLGSECTGKVDAAYPDSGTNQECACESPQAAASQMSGEDIMMIKNGSYAITSTVDIPSGSAVQKTRVYGESYANCSDYTLVELHGQNVTDVMEVDSYTDIRCLTITDHSECVTNGPYDLDNTCDTDEDASYGIRFVTDSQDYKISDVLIYGMRHAGVFGQRMNGPLDADNFHIIGNGFVGWDSDGTGDDTYTGDFYFDNLWINWSGCSMKYPLVDSDDLNNPSNFHYCFGQDQGGFGDGIGLGDGDIGNWYMTGGQMRGNASDAGDWLHGDNGFVQVKKMWIEGNAGQGLKFSTSSTVEDSKVIANCGYHYQQDFTTTPAEHRPHLGYLDYADGGSNLTSGSGIAKSNINLSTGDGATLTFTGTLVDFPVEDDSATIDYTISGVTYTANVGPASGLYSGAANIYGGKSLVNASYQWTLSSSGTNEYYLEASGGGNPSIAEPAYLHLNFSTSPSGAGTAGSLGLTQWDWADNDTLGFSTVYVRIIDEVNPDPDDQVDGYVNMGFVNNGSSNYIDSYLNVLTSAYKIIFSTAPDNSTNIEMDYIYNDVTGSGVYSGDRRLSWANIYFDITVDGIGTGTGGVDTFKWSKLGGAETEGVDMDSGGVSLGGEATIIFKEETGHTLNDVYRVSTTGAGFNTCRAAIAINYTFSDGMYGRLVNNTILSNQDTMIYVGDDQVGTNPNVCDDPAEILYSRNNVFIGGTEFNDGTDKTDLFYTEDSNCTEADNFDDDNSLICNTKYYSSDCDNSTYSLCYENCTSFNMVTDPATGPAGSYYTGYEFPIALDSDSPGLDLADETATGADSEDINCFDRGAAWDSGALEYGSTGECSYSTIIDAVRATMRGGLSLIGITIR